jgi:hypothetical protein
VPPAQFKPIDIMSGTTVLQTIQSTNMWYTDGGTRAYVDSKVLAATDSITLNLQTRDLTAGYRSTLAGFKISAIVGPAFNVSPLDGATHVAVDVDTILQWLPGKDPNELNPGQPLPGLNGYYVYFGEESDALYQMNGTALPVETTTYNVGTLSMDKTYYWQIEEAMDNGLGGSYAAGDPNNFITPVWSFKTLLSVPVITSQPQRVLVYPGATATFIVTAESISTMSFKWYYSPDNANNTPGDDVLQSSTIETLGIPNAQVVNEGYYYCVVSNASGTDAVSSTAFLEIKRLVAWYALEGDVT